MGDWLMNTFTRIFAVAALTATLASPALAQRRADARISFSGGSVAFLAGVNWGSGTLTYRGHNYPLRVRGLAVGAVGANSYRATGVVYHLRRVSDIEGSYGAMEGSMTAGGGQGGVGMKKEKGGGVSAPPAASRPERAAPPTPVRSKIEEQK